LHGDSRLLITRVPQSLPALKSRAPAPAAITYLDGATGVGSMFSSLLASVACWPETDRAVCAHIVILLAGEEAETQLCGLDRPPLTCRPAGGVAGSAAERLNDAACLAEVGVARAGDRALVLTTMALVRLAQGRDPEALNLGRKAAPAKGADDRGIAEAIQTVRAIAEARCGDRSEAARLIRGVLAGGSVDDVAPHIRNLVELAIAESPVAPLG
jgi:hypothetical protein